MLSKAIHITCFRMQQEVLPGNKMFLTIGSERILPWQLQHLQSLWKNVKSNCAIQIGEMQI